MLNILNLHKRTPVFHIIINHDVIPLLSHSISLQLVFAAGTASQYTFCMCNPPFFEDDDIMLGESRTSHRAPPKSVCTATPPGD